MWSRCDQIHHSPSTSQHTQCASVYCIIRVCLSSDFERNSDFDNVKLHFVDNSADDTVFVMCVRRISRDTLPVIPCRVMIQGRSPQVKDTTWQSYQRLTAFLLRILNNFVVEAKQGSGRNHEQACKNSSLPRHSGGCSTSGMYYL